MSLRWRLAPGAGAARRPRRRSPPPRSPTSPPASSSTPRTTDSLAERSAAGIQEPAARRRRDQGLGVGRTRRPRPRRLPGTVGGRAGTARWRFGDRRGARADPRSAISWPARTTTGQRLDTAARSPAPGGRDAAGRRQRPDDPAAGAHRYQTVSVGGVPYRMGTVAVPAAPCSWPVTSARPSACCDALRRRFALLGLGVVGGGDRRVAHRPPARPAARAADRHRRARRRHRRPRRRRSPATAQATRPAAWPGRSPRCWRPWPAPASSSSSSCRTPATSCAPRSPACARTSRCSAGTASLPEDAARGADGRSAQRARRADRRWSTSSCSWPPTDATTSRSSRSRLDDLVRGWPSGPRAAATADFAVSGRRLGSCSAAAGARAGGHQPGRQRRQVRARPAGRSRSRWPADGWRCATAAPASTPPTCPGCSTASTGRATPAAGRGRGWGWPSCARSWRRTAARCSPTTARSGGAAVGFELPLLRSVAEPPPPNEGAQVGSSNTRTAR